MASQYDELYSSLSEQFEFTIRRKKRQSNILAVLIIIGLLYGVSNFFPVVRATVIKFVSDQGVEYFGAEPSTANDLLIFPAIALLALIMIFIVIDDGIIRLKGVQEKYLAFCYSYNVREDLKKYLINPETVYLQRILKYFPKAITEIRGADTRYLSNAAFQVKYLSQQVPWVEFTEKTMNIAKALNNVESFFEYRLRHLHEIEKLSQVANSLTKTLYTKATSDNENYINNVEELAGFIKEIEISIPQPEKGEPLRVRISRAFNYLFYEGNIVLRFICWKVVLLVVALIFLVALSKFFAFELGGELIVLTYCAVFGVAIIFAKK